MKQSSDLQSGDIRRELDHLARNGESIGGHAMPSQEPNASDKGAIEMWGRRIGRTLGWIVMALLLLGLLRNLGS